MAAEDFDWVRGDDGERRGVICGEVAHGIEVNEAGEVGELARKVFRLSGEGRELWKGAGGGFHREFRSVDRERATV